MISLTWILGIVGTLGIGGCIAAYFIFPALIPIIIKALGGLLERFLACFWCKIISGAFLIFFVGWWLGHHKAELECRAAEKNSVLAAQRQDTIAQQQATADEANRAIDIEVSAKDQHDQDLRDIAALKSRASTCAFDDIDSGGPVTGGVLRDVRAPKAKPAGRAK